MWAGTGAGARDAATARVGDYHGSEECGGGLGHRLRLG